MIETTEDNFDIFFRRKPALILVSLRRITRARYASILAKEEHDKWVRDFCALNTNIAETYGFLSHKGYGTAKHRTAILEHGTHSEHRALFLRKLFSGKATKGDSVLETTNS